MRLLFAGLVILLCVSACSTNYYDRFGGLPISSETYVLEDDSAQVNLIVTYRQTPTDKDEVAATYNVSVKPVIDANTLQTLSIDGITIASVDSTFLSSYSKPSVYNKYGKSLLANGISERLCIFTIPKAIKNYNLFMDYKIFTGEKWTEHQKMFALTIEHVEKIKIKKQ